MKFYWKATCSTCRKARTFLRENGVKAEEIDLNRGLSEAELEALIGDRDYKLFLNTRNELYRERGMKKDPPPREEAIRLMSQHPNLIRRPLFVKGKRIVFGFDPEEAAGLF